MSTLRNNKHYADQLTSYVTKKIREKENREKKQEKISKAFNSLNKIISSVVLESGLHDFIKLEEKNSTIELSSSPYQNAYKGMDKDSIAIKYTEANCEGITLAFFDEKMSIQDNRNVEYFTSFTIKPVNGFGQSQFSYDTQNIPGDYKPQLDEQHTLYYKESTGQWFLGIFERGNRGGAEHREPLEAEGIMRILYSAFMPVLK